MIVFIKDKIYTENNMVSAIVGQHGKEPWDFEISVPVNYENSFLEQCLYADIIIAGVDNTSALSPKQDFVITKIEQTINSTDNVYIISGVGKAEYLLQTSIALYKLSYDTSKDETGPDFVNRVLRTFTGGIWIVSQLGGGSVMNFPPIEKGQYLSDWFWDNFKKEKAICTVKALSEPNTFNLEIVGAEGVNSVIVNRFISKTRVWEKAFDMFYAKANNFLFKYKKTPNSSNPMPQLLEGNYPSAESFAAPNFDVPNLAAALNKIIRLEDARGTDLGLKVEAIVPNITNHSSSYQIYVFIQTKISNHTPGVRVRLKQESPELLELVRSLHLFSYYKYGSDLGSGTIVDGAVWFSEWKANPYNGPVIPDNNSPMYGIRISDWLQISRNPDTGVWYPSSFSFNILQNIPDLAAAGNIEYPELPDGHPHSNYEIYEDEFRKIEVGDEIIILGGDNAILTDKVISYENGEVHYDCTTKDLLEIEAKQ